VTTNFAKSKSPTLPPPSKFTPFLYIRILEHSRGVVSKAYIYTPVGHTLTNTRTWRGTLYNCNANFYFNQKCLRNKI